MYIPSLRNLIYALIGAIHSHPLIQNPPIYYPIIKPKGTPEQIKINKYRTYGGIELLNVSNSFLTCAVYPAYVPRNVKTGHPITERDNQKSITYTPYDFGKASPDNDTLEKVTFKLVIELHFHDVAIANGNKSISYIKANPYISEALNQVDTDSYSYLYVDNDSSFAQPINQNVIDNFVSRNTVEQKSSALSNLVVDINPGEEILRDYMELLRIVLNQVRLNPFKAKSLTVKNIDFPTSNWLEDNKNVYFHLAYMIVDVELYLPCTNYLFSSPEPVLCINTN